MYDKKAAEITGDDESSVFESYIKLNPLEILSYREAYDHDQNKEDKTVVDFKNDGEIIVLMPINEFENLLNHHFKNAL